MNQNSIESLDERDMSIAAEAREDLARRELAIGPYDLLIAGQRLTRG